jgi:hypothetical protein
MQIKQIIILQNSLNKLEKYCYNWQLTVNTKKTKVMIVQNTQSPSPNFYYKNDVSQRQPLCSDLDIALLIEK